MITIQIVGLEELRAKINATLPAIMKGLEDGAWFTYHDVQRYTGDSHGIFFGFKTEKQRKWFFASIKEGTLNYPYNRTGQLAAGWGGGPHQTNQLEYIIGPNIVRYGPYVIGYEQSRQHTAGGWQKYDAANEERLNHTLMRIKYHVDMAYA